MPKVEPVAAWKAGIISAIGTAALASATNIAINYATTEATLIRWSAVVVLTLVSGLSVGLLQLRRESVAADLRAPDKPAIHMRVTATAVDVKIYSEEVAIQADSIERWIRTARSSLTQNEGEGDDRSER